MARERGYSRCRERIVRLGETAEATEEFQREMTAELRRAIGFDSYCWPKADPATMLPCGADVVEVEYGAALPRMLRLEAAGDVLSKGRLSRGARSLSDATGGELSRSRRWEECWAPYGLADAVTAACRDENGCWGWIELQRHDDQPNFDAADVQLLADVGSVLAGALRRRAIRPAEAGTAEPPPSGVAVLDDDLRPTSWTPGARAWIDAVAAGPHYAKWGILPSPVYGVASRALESASDERRPAQVRLRARTGHWAVIEAAVLEGEDSGRVAVSTRAASSDEVLDVLCRAYALSPRERQVVHLVAEGLSTKQLAERLFISRHTVQDHLKAVFEKVAVRSRGELLATLGTGQS